MVLAIISLSMGGIFGIMFGWNDIEDANSYLLYLQMRREEKSCLIVGLLLGWMGGLLSDLVKNDVIM